MTMEQTPEKSSDKWNCARTTSKAPSSLLSGYEKAAFFSHMDLFHNFWIFERDLTHLN